MTISSGFCERIGHHEYAVRLMDHVCFESTMPTESVPILLITCSCCSVSFADLIRDDSVLVISNLGNIVPPFLEAAETDIAASIEYAVTVQGARRIIVCGHSSCGVLQSLLSPSQDLDVDVNKWLDHAPVRSRSSEENAEALRELVEGNVVLQVEHLKTYPEIERKLKDGELTIDGWVLQEDCNLIAQYDTKKNSFPILISQRIVPFLPTRAN